MLICDNKKQNAENWRLKMDINNTEVMSQVTANLIESAIKGAWNKVNKWFKDMDAKDSIYFGAAYEDYLHNTYRKYSKIKTLIYRRVPKDLYSFYECIGIKYNDNTIDASNVVNVLEIGKKSIITGSGGTGKSILFKHLFLDTIKNTEYIPVMIELRSLNSMDVKDISLVDVIFDTLLQNGFSLEREYYEYSMGEGGYVILLDGFDELNRDKAQKVSSEIKKISNLYNNNYYLISSRPSEEFIGWNDFSEMQALPLTKKQAINLINKIDFDESIKQVFCQELEDNLYEKYRSFACNPLLLNIMLLTFNNHAAIPDRLNDFYEQAFATLFNMHDATKDAYVRDIRTQLGCEDFKSVFAYICFKSYFSSEYEFSESKIREYISKAKTKYDQYKFTVDDYLEDLTSSVCMLVKDGLNYHFSHRSFQEYFAAWYTCKLTDEIQAKLLSNWIKESDSVSTDSYFTMLFNMQPEKVNKIILFPIIGLIKKKYNDVGFSLQFLSYLFNGLTVREYYIPKEEKKRSALSLRIKDSQKCIILRLTCMLNGYNFPQINFEIEDRVGIALKPLIKDTKNEISFEEALKVVDENELLDALKWFDYQVAFCISLLDKNKNKDISRKKKVSSILEEL